TPSHGVGGRRRPRQGDARVVLLLPVRVIPRRSAAEGALRHSVATGHGPRPLLTCPARRWLDRCVPRPRVSLSAPRGDDDGHKLAVTRPTRRRDTGVSRGGGSRSWQGLAPQRHGGATARHREVERPARSATTRHPPRVPSRVEGGTPVGRLPLSYPAAQSMAACSSALGKCLISPGLIQPNQLVAWAIQATSVTKATRFQALQFLMPTDASSQIAFGSMPSKAGITSTIRIPPSSAAFCSAGASVSR